MAASALTAAAARPPGGAATTGTSPATPAASAGSLPTSRRTSNSARSVLASSSARMPMPAIFGRMGSGARITTRRVTGRGGSPGSTPASQPVGEEVKLPGSGSVDLRQDSVQALDLRAQGRGLPVVILVGGEELLDAPMGDLVLGREAVPLELQLAAPGVELADFPLHFSEPLAGPGEHVVESAMALALVLELALRDRIPFRPERDLRDQPVDHAGEPLGRAPGRVAFVDDGSRPLESVLPGGDVGRVAARSLEDPVLAG